VTRPTHAGLFHVTSRSNAEEHIFRDDRDYHAGVQIIGELAIAEAFRCHGFCLMPTHYHLFAWFEDGALSPAVHQLNRRYAVGFNRRHGRRGKVFDSPFTAVEIADEGHYDWLPYYIAENPPRRPWPWSSYDREFGFVEPRNLVQRS
jgi:REP element-mobilizing transposase RayT